MTVGKEQKRPPYGNVKWYNEFFNLLGKIKVEKVDEELLTKYDVVPSSNVYKLVSGLEFLGLINEEGKATEKMESLNLVNKEDFQRSLERIVRDAYAIIFEKVNLEQITKDDLLRIFKKEYNMKETTAEEAVRIFVFLCQKAGIGLPQSIVKEIAVKKRGIITAEKIRVKRKVKPPTEEASEEKGAIIALGFPGAKVLSVRYGEYNIFTIPVDRLDDETINEIINLVTTTLKDTLNYIKRLEERRKQTQS